MKINGLQKLTLLDFPGHTACTVFLAGCDLRCPFCHNSGLISGDAPVIMEEAGLFEFLKKRKGILDGVAFTGGEPLLRPELPDICAAVKKEGFLVKLDTNGTHPDRLEKMLSAGLADYVAMDVKNSPEKYAKTAGVPRIDTEKIGESIALLLRGDCDYEFRTTVTEQLHAREDFEKIGRWIRGAKNYFLQAFADRDSVIYAGFTAPPAEKMRGFAAAAAPFVENVGLRGI